MRVVIGYGNSLRGEDAFGVDVISQLQKYTLENTKLITTFQLTPELCLELLDAKEILFVDALYSTSFKYNLSCNLKNEHNRTNLSHNISPEIIIAMLRDLYNCTFTYEIYSMTTCNFDEIVDYKKYENCVKEISIFIKEKLTI